MAEPITVLITSWLTPSLFIFVNLVIGTIVITSRFAQTNHSQEFGPQLVRSPSLLQRVRSFRLRNYEPSAESECTTQPPSLLERVRSFNFGIHTHETEHHVAAYAETEHVQPETEDPREPQLARAPSLLQRMRSMNLSRLYRTNTVHAGEEGPEPETEGPDSDSEPGGNVGAEMRKSASERARGTKCEWEEDIETVEKRRPATARVETAGEDEEVDAKADDFINSFKKQLRLQRLDSLIRYRDMLRGN